MARKPSAKTTRRSTARTTTSRKAPARKSAAKKAPARRTVQKAATSTAVKASPTPEGTSDKNHLVALVQQGTGSTAKAAKETMDAVFASITASLKKNKKVQLVGFGTFEVTRRPARKGRNPRTGEPIRIKASKGIRFKASAKLKESV